MKLQLTKVNAFQIDPGKGYLILLTTSAAMTMADITRAHDAIGKRFPNMSALSLKPGTKVVEEKQERRRNEHRVPQD